VPVYAHRGITVRNEQLAVLDFEARRKRLLDLMASLALGGTLELSDRGLAIERVACDAVRTRGPGVESGTYGFEELALALAAHEY
jgi:hypothetical protein